MSQVLVRLTPDERKNLKYRLWQRQNGRCFITQRPIDVDRDELEIDHVVPTRDKGPDQESNWALVFARANESKQASNLYVARVLAQLEQIREQATDPRGANLGDVLRHFGGAKYPLKLKIDGNQAIYKLEEKNIFDDVVLPIWNDELSGMKTAYFRLPIEYLHHDDKINPRSIGNSIRGLVEEFFKRRPQLHVPLAWIDTKETDGPKVRLFDGQHKAAAQILLDQKWLPIRLFIDPDTDVLITTNTNAGTNLRQVAFDKSTQRFLGASILGDRIERYLAETNKVPGDEKFSEKDIVEHFRGEQAQIRRYILDAQRNAVSHHEDNRLRDFIEWGGKSSEKPISYSTVEKTLFSMFIGKEMLSTSFYGLTNGENPRELERTQLTQLMSLIADAFFANGKYDFSVSSGRIEHQVQKGDKISDDHLRANRIAREEIISAWLPFVEKVITNYFLMNGVNVQSERIFQYKFPEQLWKNIESFLLNLGMLPIWVDYQLSATVFGGKANAGYWQQIFNTGNTSTGTPVIHSGGLNILEMIKPV